MTTRVAVQLVLHPAGLSSLRAYRTLDDGSRLYQGSLQLPVDLGRFLIDALRASGRVEVIE